MIKNILKCIFTIIIFVGLSNYNAIAQFGKNKVQYQDFNWKYIESKHFDIYYNEGSKYIATFAAVAAENALQSIQKTLNFQINNRITIVVYDTHNEFQQTNVVMSFMPEGVGGVTELLKNRVVVPFQGSYSQFRHVVHHELVHAVLNDMFYGGTLQSSLYSGTTAQVPLWVNEGFAEYESIGGMDEQTDMFMRDLTISEYLPGLERLDGYLAYRGGQTFFWYIAKKYGEGRVGDFLNRLKINFTVESAFRSTFNESFSDFSEKWQKELKKYYWTDLDVYDDPDEFATALTNIKKKGNFYNSSPAISPDGQKMAYISDIEGIFGIYLMNLDNKEKSEKLVSSFRARDFEDLNVLTPGISWNPEGTKIAISAKSGGEDAIFIVDAESGDYEKLTFGIKSISSVEWSPDGEKLAFIGYQNQGSDIFVYKFKTKLLTNMTGDVFSDNNPVWAPNSEEIYFISDRGNNIEGIHSTKAVRIWAHDYEQSDIYSIDIGTKIIKRITNEPEFLKTSIAVSPDNKKLLYTSNKNGISNIYELDINTGHVVPKTNSLNGITQLSLSKDASNLLFTVQINGGYDIYMMKYPFDKKLSIENLPLTKLREVAEEKKKIADKMVESDSALKEVEQSELIGYGNVDVEFSRQQLVKPNPDAIKSINSSQPLKGEDVEYEDFVENDYKLKFTPDIIFANPGYSTYWGYQGVTQMLFSDIMGDHQIYAQANLLIDLRNSSFYVGYYYLPELIDYSISGFHQAGFVYNIYNNNQVENSTLILNRFRYWGGTINASYPLDMFNRLEWGLTLSNVSREDVNDPQSPNTISRLLFIPEGRYVHDDVLWSMLGPVRGMRYNVGFFGVPKFTADGIGFMTFTGDFRFYHDFTSFLSIALRGAAGASFGPNPLNFKLGGIENWMNPNYGGYGTIPFYEPEDFAFMSYTIVMPLRGFGINQRSGSKYFLTNAELRFPLFRALLAGPLPIVIQNIMGSFFLDIGGAWDDNFIASRIDVHGNRQIVDLLMSMGIGIRTYLLGIPVKLDIAWRNEFYAWSKPMYLFSLGYDF